ncbi:MAG: hypothetical protein RLZZ624_419 [Cyanobacteriota bacterium]
MSIWTLLAQPVRRQYRLVDGTLQPHPQLDGVYDSLDAALGDAIAWSRRDPAAAATVGIEVCTSPGQWRTLRFPQVT